jgi:hypothetical protein
MLFDQRLEDLLVLRMATPRARSHFRARGIAILFDGLRGIGRWECHHFAVRCGDVVALVSDFSLQMLAIAMGEGLIEVRSDSQAGWSRLECYGAGLRKVVPSPHDAS